MNANGSAVESFSGEALEHDVESITNSRDGETLVVIPRNPSQIISANLKFREIERRHTIQEDDTFSEMVYDDRKILELPRVDTRRGANPPKYIRLQEWEGFVDEVGEETFTGRLVDLTAGDKEDTELMEFPISDLSVGDRDLLKPGAIFRWMIGYEERGGTRRRISELYLRRLPVWTRQELEDADREASVLATLLHTPNDEATWDQHQIKSK